MNAEGKEFLKDACVGARKWAKQYSTLAEAWDACANPRWMCWALDKLKYSNDIALRRFACWCVRETPLADGRKVWDLLTDERSRRAVEVAEAFCDGRATQEELDNAWDAAWDAAWVARAAARAAAWDAAWNAARAAAWNAARAARAAAWAAADAAWDAAGEARAAQATALRQFVKNPFCEEAD